MLNSAPSAAKGSRCSGAVRLAWAERCGRPPGMRATPDPYRGFRLPAEIISHAVWLYHCFGLSLREVETILAERGVVVSHESIRAWGLRFGRVFANALKKRRPRRGDECHLGEVFVRIRGKRHYLWRAVDQHGVVLDVLVQSRRSAKAAKRFLKKLLKGSQYLPRVIVTDKLKSYGAAKREIRPGVEHRQSRYLNDGAGMAAGRSRRPARRRSDEVRTGYRPRRHLRPALPRPSCRLYARPARARPRHSDRDSSHRYATVAL